MFNLYAHHQPLGRFWLFLLFVWSTLSFDIANSKASIFLYPTFKDARILNLTIARQLLQLEPLGPCRPPFLPQPQSGR